LYLAASVIIRGLTLNSDGYRSVLLRCSLEGWSMNIETQPALEPEEAA
jgi:hypothetical protein